MLGLSVNHQTKAVFIFEFHQPSLSKRSLVHKLVQKPAWCNTLYGKGGERRMSNSDVAY